MHFRFTILTILALSLILCFPALAQKEAGKLDFFGETVELPSTYKPDAFGNKLSGEVIENFYSALDTTALRPFLAALLQYKAAHKPDDWLYYQLIRRVSQFISPKAENYYRYTFYKWWFLIQSGYDVRLTVSDSFLLLHVQSNETVYNIPSRTWQGKQYVCLNYHDYGSINFETHLFADVSPAVAQPAKPFSYKINNLPEFRPADYAEKTIEYNDGINDYSFRIKINPQMKALFTNYPVVDYALQFNMPLTRPTYESLVPVLKKKLKGLNQKDGVEFLTHFTRYAFLFKPDKEVFGGEKRLTPEQTLLYDYSDCEDRAALFFFLVKEIYNLPMLVLTYPQHVTVAVAFETPHGKTIEFEGKKYTVCEPSPQRIDLGIGQVLPELRKQPCEIAYAYNPR